MQSYTKKIIHDGILSRVKDIMPKIEKKYCDRNHLEKQIATIIKRFSKSGYTISAMESCTGGGLANAVKSTSNSDVGIGITGQLGRIDPRNIGIENNKAWYAIRNSVKDIWAEIIFNMEDYSTSKKKEIIIKEIIEDLYRW